MECPCATCYLKAVHAVYDIVQLAERTEALFDYEGH